MQPTDITGMTAFISLLRGVNVGGHRKIPMADLRGLYEETLGLANVRSHVQSGNVVFTTGKASAETLRTRIEAAIEKRFGFPVDVYVYTLPEWRILLTANPWPDRTEAEPSRLHVLLLREPPSIAQMEKLEAAASGGEAALAASGAVFLYYPEGAGRSKLAETVARIFKTSGTARNWRTMLALRDLGESASGG